MVNRFWLVFVLPVILQAQWLEKIIYLPDSLSGLSTADRMVVVPTTGEVFVAGSYGECVIVFDGLTGIKRARIPLPGGVNRMCYVPTGNSIYCASRNFDTIYVIDAVSRTISHKIGIGAEVVYLSYNSIQNKLYSSGRHSPDVVVIDCNQNQVIGKIPVSGVSGASAYSPQFDRLYCFVRGDNSNQITIINCGADSVIDSITLGKIEVDQMLYNPVANKLYCISEDDDVTIIDLWNNQILNYWESNEGPCALCLNPERNKVYLGEYGGDWLLEVISGETDSVIDTIWGDYTGARSIAYDPNRDRVYALDLYTPLWSIDCATDSILDSIHYEFGESLYFSPELDRIYTTQSNGADWTNDVAIIDPKKMAITARVPLYFYLSSITYAQGSDKLYCGGAVAGSGEHMVIGIDGTQSNIVTQIPLPIGIDDMCYSLIGNKLYGRDNTTVAVIDCEKDSVIKTIPVNDGFGMFLNPVSNKLYCYCNGGSLIQVIDCYGDTTVARILVSPGAYYGFGYNLFRNKIYLPRYDALLIIDGNADTLRRKIPGDFGFSSNWCYVPEKDWVIWAKGKNIWAISGISDTVDTMVKEEYDIDDIEYNPLTGRLYTAAREKGMIYVYDVNTLQPIGDISGGAPLSLWVDTVNNLLYCHHAGESSLLTIISGETENVIGSVTGYQFCLLNPNHPRFYARDYKELGIAVFHSPVPGIEERWEPMAYGSRQKATIVRNILFLPSEESGNRSWVTTSLLDISGRKVLELKPGENDVRHIGPGVYFLKGGSKIEIKVVITK